jgi:hypothetical protein
VTGIWNADPNYNYADGFCINCIMQATEENDRLQREARLNEDSEPPF